MTLATTAAARCPALLIAAPASGQGKTTVTAALARLHVRQGRKVRVFKCGPDFLDPQIHAVDGAYLVAGTTEDAGDAVERDRGGHRPPSTAM